MRGQVWQGQKITLTSGVCLRAVGSGQSLRGIKHYDFRPDCLLLDDVEGDVGASTPLEREDTKKWFFGIAPFAFPFSIMAGVPPFAGTAVRAQFSVWLIKLNCATNKH
jgi:hypothetical protein